MKKISKKYFLKLLHEKRKNKEAQIEALEMVAVILRQHPNCDVELIRAGILQYRILLREERDALRAKIDTFVRSNREKISKENLKIKTP